MDILLFAYNQLISYLQLRAENEILFGTPFSLEKKSFRD